MAENGSRSAPGKPGREPTWTSGFKTAVGTARGTTSGVWFTLGRGILSEIYYSNVDLACTRTLELLVTDRQQFVSGEERDTRSQVCWHEAGVPAFHQVNTCKQGRYRLDKLILADPHRSALLQQVHFVPLRGHLSDYALFVVLNPHLGNHGSGNTAWVGDFKGVPMLFARRGSLALALACSAPWLSARSAMSESRTAGKTFRGTSKWSGLTSVPRTAMWP